MKNHLEALAAVYFYGENFRPVFSIFESNVNNCIVEIWLQGVVFAVESDIAIIILNEYMKVESEISEIYDELGSKYPIIKVKT